MTDLHRTPRGEIVRITQRSIMGEARVKRIVDGATFWLRQELLEEEWAREDAAQQALGISADEFRRRYRNGTLPPGKSDKISNLVAIFPELLEEP